MRKMHEDFADERDVCVLLAEALMNRTSWQLRDLRSGAPATGANTREVIAVQKRAFS